MSGIDRVSRALEAQRARMKNVKDFLASMPGFDFPNDLNLPWSDYCNYFLSPPSDGPTTPEDSRDDQIILVVNTASSALEYCHHSNQSFWLLVQEDLPSLSPWKTANPSDVKALVEFFSTGAERACTSPCYVELSPHLRVFDSVARWLQLIDGPKIRQYQYYIIEKASKRRRLPGDQGDTGDEAYRAEISQLTQQLQTGHEELEALKTKSQEEIDKLSEEVSKLKTRLEEAIEKHGSLEAENQKIKFVGQKASDSQDGMASDSLPQGLESALRAEPSRLLGAFDDLFKPGCLLLPFSRRELLFRLLQHLNDIPQQVADMACPDEIINFLVRAHPIIKDMPTDHLKWKMNKFVSVMMMKWKDLQAKKCNSMVLKPNSDDANTSSSNQGNGRTALEVVYRDCKSIRTEYPDIKIARSKQSLFRSQGDTGGLKPITLLLDRELENLADACAQRPVRYNPKRKNKRLSNTMPKCADLILFIWRQKTYAAIQQVSGNAAEPRCCRCSRGEGLWDICVRGKSGTGRCANCIVDSTSCSFTVDNQGNPTENIMILRPASVSEDVPGH